MKHRIKVDPSGIIDGVDDWYLAQEKYWFFWRTIKVFHYREDAEEYIRSKQ